MGLFLQASLSSPAFPCCDDLAPQLFDLTLQREHQNLTSWPIGKLRLRKRKLVQPEQPLPAWEHECRSCSAHGDHGAPHSAHSAPQSQGVLVVALTDILPFSLLQAASVLDVRYASAS